MNWNYIMGLIGSFVGFVVFLLGLLTAADWDTRTPFREAFTWARKFLAPFLLALVSGCGLMASILLIIFFIRRLLGYGD